MRGQLYLRKEAFVPCESHPADYDFALKYVKSLSVKRTGGRLFDVDGRIAQERMLLACSYLSAFGIKLESYMKYITIKT
jgi:hypothetical protein